MSNSTHRSSQCATSLANTLITEKPREKLRRLGVCALSDVELVALWLGTGSRGVDALMLAQELLATLGGLNGLLDPQREKFCQSKGIGEVRFAQWTAVVELCRRAAFESLSESDVMCSPEKVRHYLSLQLAGLEYEVFSALFLDNRHRVLQYKVLFNGTIDGAAVYPREVVKKCLSANAAAIIFAHNHPSGVAEPSDADIAITQKLKDALALIDVRVLDHVVIGQGVHTSLAERGLM